MKKLFITFCLMLVVLAGFTQTTYYWVGGTIGAFSAVTSWNTQLDGNGTAIPAAPAATDILVFDGSNIGGTTPATGQVTPSITTSYTITQLKFQNAADVVFYRFSSTGGLSSGTSNIIISGDGTAAHDLTIDAGSSFKITSISYPAAQGLNVLLGAGATGSVSGTVRILDGGFAKNYLHVTTANSLFFANGSNVYISNTFANSYAFSPSGGAAVANGVVFQSGSSLIFQGGLSAFTTTSAAIPIVFATGSNFIFEAGLGSTNNFTRHILPNVTIRNNATVNADGAPYNIDNLTIEAGATFRLGSSGGYPVTGNILNNGTFSTVAGTSNVIMLGNTPQTIGGSGTYSLGAFTVATDADVTLNSNIAVAGTSTTNIEGKLNIQTYTISGAGDLNLRTAASATSGGNLTTGTYTITIDPNAYGVGNTANVVVGALVSGTGIPANTYITATSSSTSTITVNKPSTLTTTGNSSLITITNNAVTFTTANTAGVDGSITSTGSRTFGSGTHYIFNAATTAPFSISSNNTTGNVTFNAAATTNKVQNIGGILTLGTGVLTIRNTDTVRLTNATDIAGAPFSASKYVATQNAAGMVGVLRMDGFTTAKTFPVGTANYYLPTTLTPGTAMDYAVSVFEGVTADGTASGAAITPAQKATVVDAVWTINRLTGSGDCQVDLNWTTPLEGSSFTTYTDPEIGIGRFNGTDWGTATGSGNNTLNTATGLFSTFSPFIVTKMGAVLPLQLKNVYAAIKSAGVEISWNVLNETAVLRYEVEKSTNRMTFTTIGIVNAANRTSYSFMDVAAQTNLVYYRLKITGINGEVKYSDIIVVRSGNNTGISMYPNPVVNTLNITGLKNNSTIKIINASGQVLSLLRTTASSMSMNVAELKAGIYVIEILNDGIKETNQTFIKQ